MTKKSMYKFMNEKSKNKKLNWTNESVWKMNKLIFNDKLTVENLCNLFKLLEKYGKLLRNFEVKFNVVC